MPSKFNNELARLAEALGAAVLISAPFWLAAFGGIGTPIDRTYLKHMYLIPLGFSHVDYIAAIIVILFATLIFWFLVFRNYANHQISKNVAFAICLFALGFCANGVRIYFLSWLNLTWFIDFSFVVVLAISASLYIAWRWRQQIMSGTFFITRISALLFFVAVINVSVAVIKLQPKNILSYTTPDTQQPSEKKSAANRVIWVIFDMLDEEIGFVRRPKNIAMPALDKFRAESIVATNAKQPGSVTIKAMPTLFTGKLVSDVKYTMQDDLLLIFSDGSRSLWTETPGIFKKIKPRQMDVALLAQNAHPYCRLFVKLMSYCTEFNRTWKPPTHTLSSGIRNFLRTLFEHIPLVYRVTVGSNIVANQNPLVEEYQQFKAEVNAVLANPIYDLVFVHWHLPHSPYYYDHKKNRFVKPAPGVTDVFTGYLGNLELTDRAFASMRKTLEEANLWHTSAVIVSADHGTGPIDKSVLKNKPIVPLMIKLPGAKGGQIISQKVTAVSSSNLVWGILSGTIKNLDDVEKTIRIKK